MEIELTQIILALLGGTTVGGVVEAIRYRNENKRLKESEVAEKETATQSAQIDLADKYFNGMLELLEKVKLSQDKGEQSQAQIRDWLERLTGRTKEVESHLARLDDKLDKVERYLNGPFHEWQLAEKSTSKKKTRCASNTKSD